MADAHGRKLEIGDEKFGRPVCVQAGKGRDETSLRAGYLQHGRKVINYGVANYNSSSDGEVEFLT